MGEMALMGTNLLLNAMKKETYKKRLYTSQSRQNSYIDLKFDVGDWVCLKVFTDEGYDSIWQKVEVES